MEILLKKYAALGAELKCVNCLIRELTAYKKMEPYNFLVQQHLDDANQIKGEIYADLDSLALQVPINIQSLLNASFKNSEE
jgi:hypothetical protein